MRRLLLVALLATAALLAGCAGTAERRDTRAEVGDEVPAATSMNEADIRFLQAMAAHTEQSVEIARSVQDRIDDPEIKMLVGAVKATEFDEHVMTRAWLQAVDSDPAATAPAQGADEGLARLRGTPEAAVDAVLCELLGTHHRTAAELARSHTEAGASPEVLAYARRVERSRTAGAELLDRLSAGDT